MLKIIYILIITTILSFSKSIPEEFPSYKFVFDSLSIPYNFAYDKNFYNFVQKNKAHKRKIYLKMLRRNKDLLFPTIISGLYKTNSNYIFTYIPIIESGLNIDIVSRTGASGLWQFTKRTGKYFKLINNRYVDQRNDPVMATSRGLEYLNKLEREYPNKKFMAIMSYNAGSGYMKRNANGIYDLSYLISPQSKIKKETKEYIQKIILMAMIGENHRFTDDREVESLKDSSRGDFLVRVKFDRLQTFDYVSHKFRISQSKLRGLNKQFKRSHPKFHFINIPRSYL